MSHKSDVSTKSHYSVEEVSLLIDTIDSATWTKMYDIAKYRSRFVKYDFKELVQEALMKILSCDRKWPTSEELLPFFSQTCRSIISNYVKKMKKKKDNISLDNINEYGDTFLSKFSDRTIDPEQNLYITEVRDHIFSIFDDDPTAKELIEGRMNDFSKKDLLSLLSLSDKEYESKWKKIRRRIEKDFQGSMYE